MRYKIMLGGVAVHSSDTPIWIDGEGRFRSAGQLWLDPTPAQGATIEAEETVQTSATEWLIDVGPFFDRFGAAKMAVLTSANAVVRALITDITVRKWIDLQRADVAQGIDAIIAAGVAGVDESLKTAILTTPVTDEENLALRRVYFS